MHLSMQLVGWILAILPLYGSTPHQGKFMENRLSGFCCERQFEQPEAFEKIYVDAGHILSMPSGFFLKRDDGQLEPMQALLSDCQGMYFLRIYVQCPLCGKCYRHKTQPEGFECALYAKEILPSIWSRP